MVRCWMLVLMLLAPVAAGQMVDRYGHYQVTAEQLQRTATSPDAPRLRAQPLVGSASATYQRRKPTLVRPEAAEFATVATEIPLDVATTASSALPMAVPVTVAEPYSDRYVPAYDAPEYAVPYRQAAVRGSFHYQLGRHYDVSHRYRGTIFGPVRTYRYGWWPRSVLYHRYYGACGYPGWGWGYGPALSIRVQIGR